MYIISSDPNDEVDETDQSMNDSVPYSSEYNSTFDDSTNETDLSGVTSTDDSVTLFGENVQNRSRNETNESIEQGITF